MPSIIFIAVCKNKVEKCRVTIGSNLSDKKRLFKKSLIKGTSNDFYRRYLFMYINHAGVYQDKINYKGKYFSLVYSVKIEFFHRAKNFEVHSYLQTMIFRRSHPFIKRRINKCRHFLSKRMKNVYLNISDKSFLRKIRTLYRISLL